MGRTRAPPRRGASAGGAPSSPVDIDDLDGVVPVAEAVPGRYVGLDVPCSVCRSGAQGVPADADRVPGVAPVLPGAVARVGCFELRRLPVTLSGEAHVDVGDGPGAGPRLPADGAALAVDGRSGCWLCDAGADAHESDGLVRLVRPLVDVVAGLELPGVGLGEDVEAF